MYLNWVNSDKYQVLDPINDFNDTASVVSGVKKSIRGGQHSIAVDSKPRIRGGMKQNDLKEQDSLFVNPMAESNDELNKSQAPSN